MVVADDAGHQSDDGICHDGSRQFATREHIVAHADFSCDEMFADAVVDALVVAAEHDQVALERKVVGYVLVKLFTIG